MYSWLLPDPEEEEEEKQTTWTEFTQLYLDLLKCVHVSEWDREEKPVVYTGVVPSLILRSLLGENLNATSKQLPITNQIGDNSLGEDYIQDDINGHQESDDEEEEEEDDLPDSPLTILTCYYIHTHKGTNMPSASANWDHLSKTYKKTFNNNK